MSDNREGYHARSPGSAGHSVLFIDSFRPRGVTDATENNATVSMFSMFDQALDAFAARKLLIEAGNSADRIAVMGSGRGGTIALLAADRTFVPSATDKRLALALAVSLGCLFHPRTPMPSASAMAEQDDIVVGQAGCNEWVKEYASDGGKVISKVYRGAARFPGHQVFAMNALGAGVSSGTQRRRQLAQMKSARLTAARPAGPPARTSCRSKRGSGCTPASTSERCRNCWVTVM